MFVNEKTPLKGSNSYVPYSFMSDREGAFRRKVRQYQCFICLSVLLTCGLLAVLAILLYPDATEVVDDFSQNDLLQRPLKKASPNVRTPDISIKHLEASLRASSSFDKLTTCSLSKYRPTNGMCNNLAQPTWGASGQPLNRLLPSDYCNGISTPRCSTNKTELPSPYLITSKINSWNDGKSVQYVSDATGMTMLLWGAFIYQDLINVPEYGLPKQLNLATSFLDGSNIYGNSVSAEKRVRTFVNGELILDKYKEQNYSSINIYWKCQNGFLAFQMLDKVLINQHNIIASELKMMNPLWDDDKLFYEAKRIVTAQIQHITYNQFLEYVIGEHQIQKFDLKPYTNGYNEKYDETIDPTISNVFAAAAFKAVFTKLSKARAQLRCDFYSLAHDIQRGREYGLPSYIKWREFCGLSQPASFDDLYLLMGTNNTESLKEIYSDINDVDLFVGIISEIPVEGSIFGEVGLCLVTEQFKRLKYGDRYWYEADQPLQKFSEEQLVEIRKTTITGLICDNFEMKGIFLRTNTSLECPINSKINLTPWLESDPTQSVNLLVKPKDTYEIVKLGKSFKNNMLSTKNTTTVVLKRTFSLTMNVANITAVSNNSTLYEVYNQKPPILIPLDRVIDPNAYTASTDAQFKGTVNGNICSGTAIIPLKSLDGPNYSLKLQFEADISFKWGKTFELDGKEEYQCRVLFQSYTKSSNPNASEQNTIPKSSVLSEIPKASEQCTIMLVGMFYHRPFYCSVFPWWCLEGQFFYWSGDMKMVFKSISNETNNTIKAEGLKTFTIKQKTENVVVDKEFASVTVVSGKISGNFETNDTADVSVSPPLDIYLDHIISPSAFDTSFEVTFSGTPVDDSSVSGSFSMAYFPIVGKGTKKTVKADYNFDFVYKYGGSIGIIEPLKTYTCKVMFPSVKKSTLSSEETLKNDIIPSRTVKGKTPFGESCSIMLSGYFQTPSFYCYLTPWWCTEEKVFHWNGDAELTLKYKYNTTDNEIAIRKMAVDTGIKSDTTINSPFQYNSDFEDKFMGHRLGGKVRKGWVQIKNSGLFQPSKTIWSGELPMTIDLPIFWTPGESDDQVELSDVYGHEVIWSCSVFQSTLQGSFSFPQYVGHGPPPMVNWMKGKFYFELQTYGNTSIYNMIVPGMSYRSRVNFHEERTPDFVPFVTPQRGGPMNEEEVYQGIRAPLILLGKYSLDRKSFSWNGSFIIVFTKSAKDFMLF